MCGRLNVIEAPIVAFLAEFLGEVPHVESRGNVAPTEPVLALRAETLGLQRGLNALVAGAALVDRPPT